MIKHRFIVSAEDFKIFAAIPSETKLLDWHRWWRPADWKGLALFIEAAVQIFTNLEKEWTLVADGYAAIANVKLEWLEDLGIPNDEETDIRRLRAAQSAETRIVAGTCSLFLEHLRHTAVLPDGDITEFTRRVVSLIESLTAHVTVALKSDDVRDGSNGAGSLSDLMQSAKRHGEFYSKSVTFRKASDRKITNEEIETGIEFGNLMRRSYDNLFDMLTVIVARRTQISALVTKLSELISSDLVPGLTCPPGVPFPAYTMEWADVVVNVVEGRAWVEGDRAPTEDERRVVEIVSQMLTERNLNPKAPTRIPTREVDPKHAHEQREADKRLGPPKVRTIKFFATPPRYLREAAESIRDSHVKAHWVIGHWRNQPWGAKNTLRRQTWIAPHIRGLGEAGASTAKVFAPKDEPKPGVSS